MIFGICITVISGLLIPVLLQNAMGNIFEGVNVKNSREKEGESYDWKNRKELFCGM